MKIQGLFQNRRFMFVLKALIVGLFVSLVLLVFPIGGMQGHLVAANVSAVAFSLLAASICFSVWFSVFAHGVSRRIWGFFTLGLFLWAVAELLWAYYEVVLMIESPYPSLADFFWVLGYGPFFLCLAARYRSLEVTTDWSRKIWILALIVTLLSVIVYLVVRPMIVEFDADRMVESLLSIFYPVGDLVLLSITTLILFAMGNGRFALSWRIILSGFLITSLGDLVFSYLSWYGLYHEQELNLFSIVVDFAFILSYACLAVGIYAYQVLLDLPRRIKLTAGAGPLVETRMLIFVDSKNRILSASDNFMLLTGTQKKPPYEAKMFHDVLGIAEDTILALVHSLKAHRTISHYPLRMATDEAKAVACTAVGLFNPRNEYDGMGLVLRTELPPSDTREPPLTAEQSSLVESFLRQSGMDVAQNASALKAYFLEQIKLLYSIVYEFNGQYVANSLLSFIAQKANEHGWPIRVEGHEISIPANYDGQLLSISLLQLLRSARSYAGNVVSLSLVDQEMSKIDQELKQEVLQVIDQYALRVKNQVVF